MAFGKTINVLSPTDAAYIAGFVDGEGSIQIRRKGQASSRDGFWYAILLSVGNTDRAVLEWLREATGVGGLVPYTEKGNRKDAWRWTIHSQQARQLLEAILPFLRVKRPQADAAILLAAQQNRGRNGTPITDAEWAARDGLYATVKRLNQRGRVAA